MIWLIGNKGMLGTELSFLLEKADLPFIGTDREVDITNPATLRDFALPRPINWIINCAAYTAVDNAEDNEATCYLLNTTGAANIAAIAKTKGAILIHISTDYVFDGEEKQPYTEESPVCPTSIYGRSKRNGEIAVLENNPNSYIIRTAWLYGKYGNNFVHTMLRLMNEREEVKVVNDQYGSPTWTFDLAKIIIVLVQQVEKRKSIPCGIYHYSNEEICTWFEFASAIYEEGISLGIIIKPCKVNPCTSSEYPTKVKRPTWSVLDKSKIKNNLCIEIPKWKDSLKEYLEVIGNRK